MATAAISVFGFFVCLLLNKVILSQTIQALAFQCEANK